MMGSLFFIMLWHRRNFANLVKQYALGYKPFFFTGEERTTRPVKMVTSSAPVVTVKLKN